MVSTPLPHNEEQKNWKTIFMVTSILLVIIMLFLSKDYGLSGDEWLQIIYGQDIWNYFHNGNQQALDYGNKGMQYMGLEYYGGTFDYIMEELHHWMPSIPLLLIRHFFNALCGSMMMVFTGLLARRLSGKWMVGVLALLFIVFSPRLFGESMNNPKDIPFAAGFIIAVYCLVSLFQDLTNRTWKHGVGIALGLGLAFGVRPAGGILLLAYFALFGVIYFYFNKPARASLFADNKKILKRLGLVLAGSIVLGYIIGLSTWPWGQQAPLSNPLTALKGMTNREAYLRVLFEGLYYWSQSLPLYYEFKWIVITNPIVVLAGFVMFLALFTKLKSRYGWFAVIVPVWGALFPLLYMMYKHSTVYDTWRHVFFVYPFWVIAGAMAWDYLAVFIKDEKKKWIPVAVAVAGLLPTIIWTVRSHPNQYIYFNQFTALDRLMKKNADPDKYGDLEIVGGAKGAYGFYDLDYYQNGGRQAVEWLLKNVKPIPGKKILVRSNMAGLEKYFTKDTSWIVYDYGRYSDRHWKDWDYYIAYPRYISTRLMQHNKWNLQNTVHAVTQDGVPLSLTLKRASYAGTAANNAYTKKDYATAVPQYAAYIQADSTDEFVYMNYAVALGSIGRLPEAIIQAKKAIQLDDARPDFYEILAQLYKASGNRQAEQEATLIKNDLLEQQSPPEAEPETE